MSYLFVKNQTYVWLQSSFYKVASLHGPRSGSSVTLSVPRAASINGDGAAQPAPPAAEQQGPAGSHRARDANGASWPAPFDMPASVSEDPSASSQVSSCRGAALVGSCVKTKPVFLLVKIDERE